MALLLAKRASQKIGSGQLDVYVSDKSSMLDILRYLDKNNFSVNVDDSREFYLLTIIKRVPVPMFDMVNRWYKRRFSDPNAVSLVAILLFGFVIIYFFGHLIAPLLVAIVLAYLLEWPVNKLAKLGLPRTLSVALVLVMFVGLMILAFFGLIPTVWNQVGNLINDIPVMYAGLQEFLNSMPDKYPELANLQIVESIVNNTKSKVIGLGETVVKGSLASLVSIAAIAVYMILCASTGVLFV